MYFGRLLLQTSYLLSPMWKRFIPPLPTRTPSCDTPSKHSPMILSSSSTNGSWNPSPLFRRRPNHRSLRRDLLRPAIISPI